MKDKITLQAPVYQLSFHFEHHGGGCLWPRNEAAIRQFDGPLDCAVYDLDGSIKYPASLALPPDIIQIINVLDDQYATSFNMDDPAGNSIWSPAEWESFFDRARQLYQQLCEIISDEFEIIYDINEEETKVTK